ncbi:MAG: hypothetical protein IPL74_12765 [Bacteroidetes bacterium]|nr:hypothetical protein [Bacteroidota bacterium]
MKEYSLPPTQTLTFVFQYILINEKGTRNCFVRVTIMNTINNIYHGLRKVIDNLKVANHSPKDDIGHLIEDTFYKMFVTKCTTVL